MQEKRKQWGSGIELLEEEAQQMDRIISLKETGAWDLTDQEEEDELESE